MREVFAGALLFAAVGWSFSSRVLVNKTQETTTGKRVLANRRIPYTAQYKLEWIRPKTDVVSGTSALIETDAISSNGWQMNSQTIILPSGELGPTTDFDVLEISSQIHYSWLVVRPGQKALVKHRVKVTRPPPGHAAVLPGSFPTDNTAWPGEAPRCEEDRPSLRMHLSPDMEDLGTKTIDGIPVMGMRWVTTIPAVGESSEPYEKTFETWDDDTPCHGSLMVEYVITQPGLKYTEKLLNVTWDEPSSDLFNPPSDYEIPADGPVEAPRP